MNRNCPKCNKEITYTSKRWYREANKKNKLCVSCAVSKSMIGKTWDKLYTKEGVKLRKKKSIKRMIGKNNIAKRKEVREKLSELQTGKNNSMYGKRYKCSDEKKKNISKALTGRKLTEEHKENTRIGVIEKQLGFKYDDWVDSIGEKKLYYNNVWRVTNNQPIEILENFDKRGRNDYHLDHKISISGGFRKDISPEIIGNIKNLRFIPYRENLSKGTKSIYE